jgi:hypothetical protein
MILAAASVLVASRALLLRSLSRSGAFRTSGDAPVGWGRSLAVSAGAFGLAMLLATVVGLATGAA